MNGTCDRCGSTIAENAPRYRVRLSRSWFEEDYRLQGDRRRKRLAEKSRGIVTGTLCEGCAEAVGKAIERALVPPRTDIAELDLSVRAYNTLKRARIDTVEQLEGMTDDELRAVPRMRNSVLDEIEMKLKGVH